MSSRWRHYKGGTYDVIDQPATATDSINAMEQVTIYYDETGKCWVRPSRMWREEIAPGVERFTAIDNQN